MREPSSNSSSRFSSPPSEVAAPLTQLTEEQRERLTEVLDRYLLALEHDAPLAHEELLAEHPDLADALRSYFRSLEELHDMAAGFGGPPRGKESADGETDGAKRIGDFELIREVGRGGMGVVYEARQISLDRRVAVKLLPFAAVLDSKQIARFKHEAQAAAQLHHPNIVPVFAIGVERGVHFYAMQYIDGQPLDVAIQELKAHRARRGRVQGSEFRVQKSSVDLQERAGSTIQYSVPSTQYDGRRSEVTSPKTLGAPSRRLIGEDQACYFRRVAEIGVQAAQALHAAHEYGVVHRDIKPSNLLLEADGKLWITDFGLARFQRDASLTRTGDLVGTMRYMSPEQAAGRSALVDQRTDIYSLGVTLYELVCLQPAFPEDRGPALLKQIDSYDPPRPAQIRPEIPPDLETVILKAMARERDDRYATAQQLADDLACVLEGKATQARPPTLLDRAGRWASRHRRTMVVSIAGMLIALVGLSATTFMITRLAVRANKSAVRADKFYQSARSMLDQLGMQIAQQLDDVPGADAIREDLLKQAQQYYKSFIEEAKSDPRLRVDAAVTLGKLGSLFEQLADSQQSLDAHQKAATILHDLAAKDPGNFKIESQLAVAENNVGLALRRLGKKEPAREQLEQAIRRQEKLLTRDPHNGALETDLALSLCNLGLLEHESGRSTEARASLDSAIDHFKRVLGEHPEAADCRRKLAAAYNNLAATYRDERPAEAARLHGQALELLQTAAKSSTSDLTIRRELAVTLSNLAGALSRAKQTDAARSAYEKAIGIQEELARLAPARASYRVDLVASMNNLGMLENRSGQADAAAAHFGRAVELYEKLHEQLPGDTTILSNLGSVYHNWGVALERGDQLKEASDAFAKAIDHQRAALDRSPDLPGGRELLASHYENQGRILRKLGQLP